MNANKNVDNFSNYVLLGLCIIFSIVLFTKSYDIYNTYTNSIAISSLSDLPNEGWALLLLIGSVVLMYGLAMAGLFTR